MIVAVVVNMVYEEGHINAQRFTFFDLVHGDGLRMNQNRRMRSCTAAISFGLLISTPHCFKASR